jgi:hypothetical protein
MAKELFLDCRCPACGLVSPVTKTTALASPGAVSLPVPPSHQSVNSSFDEAGCGNGGYIGSAEAARYLKMHVKTLLKKARQGIYPSHGEGRLRKFLRHELDQVMQRNATAKAVCNSGETVSTKHYNGKAGLP